MNKNLFKFQPAHLHVLFKQIYFFCMKLKNVYCGIADILSLTQLACEK